MTDFTLDTMANEPGKRKSDSSRGAANAVPKEKPRRSFAKAISWRIVGTLDTFFLSFFIIKYLGPIFGLSETGNDLEIAATASYIAVAEIITKIAIYTVHERVWNRIHWGVMESRKSRHERKLRSLVKMSTWRVLASLDTMVLAYIFTGNIGTAISIGGLEVITKLVLYFFHERVWLKIKFGLEA